MKEYAAFQEQPQIEVDPEVVTVGQKVSDGIVSGEHDDDDAIEWAESSELAEQREQRRCNNGFLPSQHQKRSVEASLKALR